MIVTQSISDRPLTGYQIVADRLCTTVAGRLLIVYRIIAERLLTVTQSVSDRPLIGYQIIADRPLSDYQIVADWPLPTVSDRPLLTVANRFAAWAVSSYRCNRSTCTTRWSRPPTRRIT